MLIQIERHDTTVRVAVSDTGMGIPQAELPLLFGRFYRASNVDERQISGLGIGLYIVKELVTLHGGTIEAVSEEGRGSTFIVTLPLLEDHVGGTSTECAHAGSDTLASIQTPLHDEPAKDCL